MVFIEKKNILNHYGCRMFKNGCPNARYFSDEIYKCKYSFKEAVYDRKMDGIMLKFDYNLFK